MRLASIDLPFSDMGAAVTAYRFMETGDISSFDTALWNPLGVLDDVVADLELVTPPTLKARASEVLLTQARHWRRQFKFLLERGGTIAVIVPPPSRIGVHTFQEVIPYDVLEPLLPLSIETAEHIATAIECSGGDPFLSFFQDIHHLLNPSAHIVRCAGIPTLTDGVGNVLACYIAAWPGRILFLPQLSPRLFADTDESNRFVGAFTRCVEKLCYPNRARNAPWLRHYRDHSQRAKYDQRNELQRQLHQINAQLAQLEEAIEEEEGFKQLIGGSGRGLYSAVSRLLTEKGAFIQADWLDESILLADYGEELIVVKTITSGEELCAVQLKTIGTACARVSDYFGKRTKCLIVDCTRNDDPLAERDPEATLRMPDGSTICDCACVQGVHLYGWHRKGAEKPLDTTIDAIFRSDKELLGELWQTAETSLKSH